MSSNAQTPEPNREKKHDLVVHDSAGNWVDHRAPAPWRPYLRLSRFDRPIGTWLLFIPCLWGLALALLAAPKASEPNWQLSLWVIMVCAFGALLMRGAGCTWNDISDYKFDAQVARTKSRPIPAGQVTRKKAALWMALQIALSAGLLFTLNTTSILLGILALLPVAVYPFAKRITWWPQVVLGLAINFGVLLAWAAQGGPLSLAPVFLYGAGVSWTLFYDTIYAHQDTEDDALIGVKSTALLFGDTTAKWLRRFLVTALALMTLSIMMATQERSLISALIALCGAWAMGIHMTIQLAQFRPDDSERLLTIFRSNRTAGLLPVLFFAGALIT